MRRLRLLLLGLACISSVGAWGHSFDTDEEAHEDAVRRGPIPGTRSWVRHVHYHERKQKLVKLHARAIEVHSATWDFFLSLPGMCLVAGILAISVACCVRNRAMCAPLAQNCLTCDGEVMRLGRVRPAAKAE